MKMINKDIQEEEIKEDYVSVEIAKLLKEKGFIGEVRKYYLIHEDGFAELFDKKDEFPSPEDVWIPAPTLNVACKWIRKKYNIHIGTKPWNLLNPEPGIWYKTKTTATIYKTRDSSLFGDKLIEREFCEESPEQAIEAGLLYILENLI